MKHSDPQDADWRDTLYRRVFEEELRGLEKRRASDAGCSADDARAMLRRFYEMEGADWLGRGEVQNITLQATIAAYETFTASASDGSAGA
jgi:hypothetical protein